MQASPLYLSREQARAVDRIAVERYGVPGVVLMENAARAAAATAQDMLGGRPEPVLILCGGGNNGGDGLAIARHLHNAGHRVTVALTVEAARYGGDALVNWKIVEAMGMPVVQAAAEMTALIRLLAPRDAAAPAGPGQDRGERPALIVDAVFGTGLTRAPREPFAALAAGVDASGLPVLAVDVPSGLDCDSGRPLGACIRATRTITFAALKQGFANPESRPWTGEVVVGDIGCPREVIMLARAPKVA